MKIGLNLLYLLPGEVGGTETYAQSLIHALAKIDQQNTYYLYLNHESSSLDLPQAGNFIPVRCRLNASNRFLRFAWEQSILPFQAAYHRLDILHSLGYISPLILTCAPLVTIHDLNYLFIPQAFTPFTSLVQRFFVTSSVKRARRIIAVSEFTKNELATHLGVPEARITVTHEAPKPRLVREVKARESREGVFDELGIHQPYLLAFSSLAPHKNIAGLIRAFRTANDAQDKAWTLVIAGHLPAQGLNADLLQPQGSQAAEIVTTGYVSDTQIVQLYRSAGLFAFPSFYEGFGIPALEAMQYGIPVACSNRGALPEVAEGAAQFFDPADVPGMAAVLSELMRDPDKREQLRQRGAERVKRFSWEKTAHRTLEVYQSLMERS